MRVTVAVLLVPFVACAVEDPDVASSTTGSTDPDESSSAAPETTDAEDASTTDAAESTTGDAPAPMIPARGLQIDWVEANQGVGVPIGQDGAWVGASERVARLLKNRNTLVRAFWTLEPDFVPREIEAHLILEHADGTTERLVQSKLIEDDAFIGDLDRVFYWGIEAQNVQPGIEYAIELYEVDPSYADGAPEAPPYFPEVEGEPVLIGIEDSYQLIKVTVVPFNYDDGASCVTEPDTTEETMQLFEDMLFMMNPVDTVEYTLHDAVDWNTPLESFGQLNSFLSDLRFDEGAPPEMYYYGLVDVCSGGLGGAGGQAFGIPQDPIMENAYQRVSSGLSLDPDWSAETFVHEVGHSQGRYHVYCNGEEGGPDPSYPNQGGDVGEWGFGVVDFGLRHPTVNKDYMTYCHPVWVGSWGWNKVQPTVETLSMWDPNNPNNGAPRPDDPYAGSLLVGTIGQLGAEDWITVPGRLDTGALAVVSDDVTIEIAYADGRRIMTPAVARMLPDGNDRQIVIPLPDAFATVISLARIEAGHRIAIDRDVVRERHTRRSVRQ